MSARGPRHALRAPRPRAGRGDGAPAGGCDTLAGARRLARWRRAPTRPGPATPSLFRAPPPRPASPEPGSSSREGTGPSVGHRRRRALSSPSRPPIAGGRSSSGSAGRPRVSVPHPPSRPFRSHARPAPHTHLSHVALAHAGFTHTCLAHGRLPDTHASVSPPSVKRVCLVNTRACLSHTHMSHMCHTRVSHIPGAADRPPPPPP